MTLQQLKAKINTHWMHNETGKVVLVTNVGTHNGWDSVLIGYTSTHAYHQRWIPIDDFLRDYYEVHEVTRWERVEG